MLVLIDNITPTVSAILRSSSWEQNRYSVSTRIRKHELGSAAKKSEQMSCSEPNADLINLGDLVLCLLLLSSLL